MAWLENVANLFITGAICTYAVYDFFRERDGQQHRQVIRFPTGGIQSACATTLQSLATMFLSTVLIAYLFICLVAFR